jgi:hypothetical protein
LIIPATLENLRSKVHEFRSTLGVQIAI